MVIKQACSAKKLPLTDERDYAKFAVDVACSEGHCSPDCTEF